MFCWLLAGGHKEFVEATLLTHHTSCPPSKGEGCIGHETWRLESWDHLGVCLPLAHLCIKGEQGSIPLYIPNEATLIQLDHLSLFLSPGGFVFTLLKAFIDLFKRQQHNSRQE